jgi:hypothetical protein
MLPVSPFNERRIPPGGTVTCPDPETLAALAEGHVSRREMATLAAHVANA